MLGQPLVPANPGNQWVLKSIYTSAPITLSVKSTKAFGPRTVIDFQQIYPWATYSLLLSQDANGVSFEGFTFNGATYWSAAPAILFKTTASPGQTWTTPLGDVGLISKTATVEATGQTFTGVYLFSLGSSAQVWGFKPGYGVVSYTINGVEFKLNSGTGTPYSPPNPNLQTRTCPSPGLTAIPEDSTITDAQREGILNLAMSVGSKNLIVGAAWSELEPAKGTYNLTRIANELQLAAKYNLATVLSLRVPQTASASLPSYLAGKSLNDPVVLTRLNALISLIAPLLPSQVKWINIGYEVDTYFFLNPSGLVQYLAMFDSARTKWKTLKPAISVGPVFSFDSTRANDQMFRSIVDRGDHISFTYYALTGDFEQRDPSSPAFDVPLMISMAAGKPILLVEMGYSSGLTGQTAQSQFFSSALSALRLAGGAVAMFSGWSYRDISASSVASISLQFGQSGPAFAQFITSAGLLDQNGVPKLAWPTFINALPPFASPSTCTGF